VLLNPALPYPPQVARPVTGALLIDRKTDLRIDMAGVRAASRSTEAEAISRASLWGVGPGGGYQLGLVPFRPVVEVTFCEL
jgi:hypothetical protein